MLPSAEDSVAEGYSLPPSSNIADRPNCAVRTPNEVVVVVLCPFSHGNTLSLSEPADGYNEAVQCKRTEKARIR